AVESVFRLDELQIEIAGTFLLILPQQVIGHFAVLTAEGIQPVGTQIAVQHEGNKALGGDGFARAVLTPQQKASLAEGELLPVIEPEVYKSQFVHPPAFLHHCPSLSLLGIDSLPQGNPRLQSDDFS